MAKLAPAPGRPTSRKRAPPCFQTQGARQALLSRLPVRAVRQAAPGTIARRGEIRARRESLRPGTPTVLLINVPIWSGWVYRRRYPRSADDRRCCDRFGLRTVLNCDWVGGRRTVVEQLFPSPEPRTRGRTTVSCRQNLAARAPRQGDGGPDVVLSVVGRRQRDRLSLFFKLISV